MTYDEFQKLLVALAEAEAEHEARCQEYHEEHDDWSLRRMLAAYRRVDDIQSQVDAELEAERSTES